MSKPASVPTWATTANYSAGTYSTGTPTKVSPGSVANEGYRRGVAPLAQHANYHLNLLGQWCTWANTDVLCADGGTFSLSAPIIIDAGTFRIDSATLELVTGTFDADTNSVVNLAGSTTFTAVSSTSVLAGAAWEFANDPIFSGSPALNGGATVATGEIVDFGGGGVQISDTLGLYVGTATPVYFNHTVRFESTSATNFLSGSTITGAPTVTATIVLSGAGHITKRIIDDVDATTGTLTVSTGDIVFVPTQTAAGERTISNATEGAEIVVTCLLGGSSTITDPTKAITLKNQDTTSINALLGGTPGSSNVSFRMVFRAATSKWQVIERTPG